MSKQIMVPDIGADEVEVTEIMVAVGDKVELDQSIIAVEGDKASMEVPAPSAGIVKEILIKVGDKVATGSQIMISKPKALLLLLKWLHRLLLLRPPHLPLPCAKMCTYRTSVTTKWT